MLLTAMQGESRRYVYIRWNTILAPSELILSFIRIQTTLRSAQISFGFERIFGMFIKLIGRHHCDKGCWEMWLRSFLCLLL
jgi:hypothetical protein